MPRKMNLDKPNWVSNKQNELYSNKVSMRPFLPEDIRVGKKSPEISKEVEGENGKFVDFIVKK
ncbi:hypothetical protein [Lachnobacterium bovis]|uniref:Uncharacterized protein n=1 Tax=Lachnobacterium bovis TaxID=140626 RepID=A0A1H9TF99_9FIRM|nr:hypothetical protein [Lachnobacterium bovis]SER95644.1 hypothetical protein SAMN02910429_01607 [Lachnobacterium bovis]